MSDAEDVEDDEKDAGKDACGHQAPLYFFWSEEVRSGGGVLMMN